MQQHVERRVSRAALNVGIRAVVEHQFHAADYVVVVSFHFLLRGPAAIYVVEQQEKGRVAVAILPGD